MRTFKEKRVRVAIVALVAAAILSGILVTVANKPVGLVSESTTTVVKATVESTTTTIEEVSTTVTTAVPTTSTTKLTTTTVMPTTTTIKPKSTTITKPALVTTTTITVPKKASSTNADRFRQECRDAKGRVLCIDSKNHIMGAFRDGELLAFQTGIGVGCPATPTSKGWFTLFFPNEGWGKFRAEDKAWWSEEFDVWMSYFVGIDISKGIGTHYKSGSGCSHGCVRNTSMESAKAFYYALYPGGRAFVY